METLLRPEFVGMLPRTGGARAGQLPRHRQPWAR